MMKTYRDFYGAHACIRTMRDGSARLTVRVCGKLIYAKNYQTERGAKIAMGKLGDGWHEK